MTPFEAGYVTGIFEGKGSYCLAPQFSLEVMVRRRETLILLQQYAGGHIYPPPPSHPERWTWRLYGKAAQELYEAMRPYLSEPLRARGDRKRDQGMETRG